MLKSVVVPFEMGISEKPALPTSTAKATKINPAHTISLRQTECRKTGETITAAVYEYLVDNDGEWGELRFDFENGTAEIIRLADWDTVKSKVFAKAAIRFAQGEIAEICGCALEMIPCNNKPCMLSQTDVP